MPGAFYSTAGPPGLAAHSPRTFPEVFGGYKASWSHWILDSRWGVPGGPGPATGSPLTGHRWEVTHLLLFLWPPLPLKDQPPCPGGMDLLPNGHLFPSPNSSFLPFPGALLMATAFPSWLLGFPPAVWPLFSTWSAL
jgi:hypothetical protein